MQLESWDAWTSDDTHAASYSSRYGTARKSSETQLEPEVDYFQELQLEPSISKTKKVRH